MVNQNAALVIGHSKSARAGGMKSSHFSGSEIRRWFAATPHGLLETEYGECSQDGTGSVDTTTICGRLVTAADRQRTGDRPRHGSASLTTATTRPKTSHFARRLGRCKTSHYFALPGSG